jgi:putative SbcD/Mre11-related phosphoesterase
MQWQQWLLTPQRVAVDLDRAVAVVADLHLGYAAVRQRGGEAIPLPSLVEELQPLAQVVQQYAVRQILVAGDLFEDGRQPRQQLEAELLAWAESHDIRWRIVPGNHDRGLADSLLEVVAQAQVGPWYILHGDQPAALGQDVKILQGHEHPWLGWRRGPGQAVLGGPCYLLSDTHVVLPAYSANAAGVNVRNQARWAKYHAAVIAGDRVLDFGLVGELG